MIKIVQKDLLEDYTQYDLVLLGVNIMNTSGKGFRYMVALNHPEVYSAIHNFEGYGNKNKLGTVEVVEMEPSFALCYITTGRYRPQMQYDVVDYAALKKCLGIITKHFKGKKIASTIMGHSPYEGGGDKQKILSIFEEVFTDVDITLYDYVQKNAIEERSLDWTKVTKLVGTDQYEEAKKQYYWKWHFGTIKQMPPDITLKDIKKLIKGNNEKA